MICDSIPLCHGDKCALLLLMDVSSISEYSVLSTSIKRTSSFFFFSGGISLDELPREKLYANDADLCRFERFGVQDSAWLLNNAYAIEMIEMMCNEVMVMAADSLTTTFL